MEYIKEYPSNRILGIIESCGGNDLVAKHYPSRRILGYYRANRNVTTDIYGRTIATGNCLSGLIFQAK